MGTVLKAVLTFCVCCVLSFHTWVGLRYLESIAFKHVENAINTLTKRGTCSDEELLALGCFALVNGVFASFVYKRLVAESKPPPLSADTKAKLKKK
ncbi:hypothetical protein COU76_01170 [Candidatus Peregrinibacteria bacterium CG10_big_fil_rev_8_21_14_0_10_49_10]|nr:MAG: hypothetical protein COU76_01170 [Candidatus Peregrinibacteria bacterium CG10_big_fil_rev_8_21_14_0_10_49_10]